MARVAVLHNTLDGRGGADAVCLHVCEALQDRHDVTLFTLSRSSLSDLNALFDTAAQVPVHRPSGTRLVCRAFDALPDRFGPQLAARSVLLRRLFAPHAADFDAAVSTANEFDLPLPSLQYIHFPQFNCRYTTAGETPQLDPLWSRLAGVGDRVLPDDARLYANSAWTADAVADIYGRRPAVCHPPVDLVPNPRPWAEREAGVVVLGRLAPDKRPLRAIRIVDGIRARGHDLHLHLVGSSSSIYTDYARRVAAAAAERSYVHLHRDAARERVETLLATHRYGLNCKPEEHFGMAVAEYVAAGMVAFAPDAGGQREVLDWRADRLFTTTADAVATISAAIDGDDRPALPRDRYASERFHAAIRDGVDAMLDG
ncbi:glycosyltransferase [Haloplanus aerogenes]|uniref:Glycosyl transferase family 4 n=1 Tax=Haloplanus aerogenes TaxID=660522 RepID=A0A3M0CW97_9EURY|nr:glycosyltransferase [Haloplanus aerogenes]AZH24013.1 glycosyltransferase [Haloplanus aerogenes]RMB13217.1 glycosyl transferase family 4 [Haloplanus aerogenes]